LRVEKRKKDESLRFLATKIMTKRSFVYIARKNIMVSLWTENERRLGFLLAY
jgi:hypothetical protein